MDETSDEITFVIPADAGITISGAIYNFVSDEYVITGTIDSEGTITISDDISAVASDDYAGSFNLPIKVVTTDSESGVENVLEISDVSVTISPISDSGSTTLIVESTTIVDESQENYGSTVSGSAVEGGSIAFTLSDLKTNDSDQINGSETINSITVTLEDSSLGCLSYEGNADSVEISADGSTITISGTEIDSGVLKGLVFTPSSTNQSGQVTFDITADVTDTAGELSDERTVSFGTVSFDITAVADSINVSLTDQDTGLAGTQIIGDEDSDGGISLGAIVLSLNDTDGSEQIISIKLTNIPDDFLVVSDVYTVNNNGDGEWSILIDSVTGGETLSLSDIYIIPSEDFSGTISDIGIVVYSQESEGDTPIQSTQTFDLVVNPVSDVIDTRIDSSAEGIEGGVVDIQIDARIVDDSDLGLTDPNVENSAETVYLVISDVPDGVSVVISDPDSLSVASDATEWNDGDSEYDYYAYEYPVDSGNWIIETNLQEVMAIQLDLNGTDYNSDAWSNQDSEVTISVSSNDNGDIGNTVAQTVKLDITAVNDQPVVTIGDYAKADEDVPLSITSIQIDDADQLDNPDADVTVTFTNSTGTISFSQESIDYYNDSDPQLVAIGTDDDGNVTLTGTISNINALLSGENIGESSDKGLIYTSDENSYEDADITVVVNDNGNGGEVNEDGSVDQGDALTSEVLAFTIVVNAVNDAPENTLFDSLSVDEGSITKLTGLAVSDVDATTQNSTQMTVTLSVDYGQLTVKTSESSGVTITITDSTEIVIEGSLEEINAFLSSTSEDEGIFYTVSAENDETSATLTMVTNDGGNYDSVSSAELTDTDTATISIVPVVSGIPELQLALQTQKIKTSVSAMLAAIGIPLIGLSASLANSLDTDESVVIKISGLPSSAYIDADGATLVGTDWYISADQLDSAQVYGLKESTTLSIVAIGQEEGAEDVMSEVTSVSIDVSADDQIGSASESTSILAVGGDDDEDIYGSDYDDILVGGAGNDHLYGGDGDDQLYGDDGKDYLYGGDGSDQLYGGDGDDQLYGGLGADILTGGSGSDNFIWTQSDVESSSKDIITDFDLSGVGEDADVINLVSLLDDDDNGSITVNDLLTHVSASIIDHDDSGSSKDIQLNIVDDNAVVQQTIIVEGLGDHYSSSTDLINDLIGDHVFKVDS